MSENTPLNNPDPGNFPPARLWDRAGAFLDIRTQPSRLLAIFYTLIHGFLLIAVVLAFIPVLTGRPVGVWWAILAILVMLLFVGAVRTIQSARVCYRLRLDSTGWWLGRNNDGLELVSLQANVLAWPSLVVVGFAPQVAVGKPVVHWLLLSRDSCDGFSWRRLRVWLLLTFRTQGSC